MKGFLSSIANSVKRPGDRRHPTKPYKYRMAGHLHNFTPKFLRRKQEYPEFPNAHNQHAWTVTSLPIETVGFPGQIVPALDGPGYQPTYGDCRRIPS